MSKNKVGGRTREEIDVLADCVKRGMSTEDISKLMKRREPIIKKWIKELHFGAIANREQADDIARLLDVLHKKYFWLELKEQFSDNELKYFESSWIALMLQFKEDILPAEEIQIKQLVTIEILINRSMKERRKHMEEIEKLQKEINAEYKLEEDLRDAAKLANLEQQIACARNSIGQYTTEYTKLLGEQKTINTNLKATRDQRIKRIEDSKTTFAGLLRALDDEDLRRRMGDEAELMRLAKDKSKEKLSQVHIFSDGQGDFPLLTPEVVEEMDDLEDINKERKVEDNAS